MKKQLLLFLSFISLCHYSMAQWTTYSSPQIPAGNVTMTFIDAQNKKWFAIQNQGLALLDNGQWTFLDTSDGMASMRVTCMLQDIDGNYWFGTQAKGVMKYDGSQWTSYPLLNDSVFNPLVYSIAEDNDGKIWVGGTNGVCVFDDGAWAEFSPPNYDLSNKVVRSIMVDHLGHLWFGHNMGLTFFNGNIWFTYTPSNSGVGGNIMAVEEDAQHNIWVASFSAVAKFNFNSWQSFYLEGVTSMHIDVQNNKWFGTLTDGVLKYDNSNGVFYSMANSGIIDDAVYSITSDNECRMWFGNAFGISELATCMSLDENVLQPLQVYPNPLVDQLNITYADENLPLDIYLYDSNGKLIFSKNITSNSIQIDMAGYGAGVYFLKSVSAENSGIYKVIKQ